MKSNHALSDLSTTLLREIETEDYHLVGRAIARTNATRNDNHECNVSITGGATCTNFENLESLGSHSNESINAFSFIRCTIVFFFSQSKWHSQLSLEKTKTLTRLDPIN